MSPARQVAPRDAAQHQTSELVALGTPVGAQERVTKLAPLPNSCWDERPCADSHTDGFVCVTALDNAMACGPARCREMFRFRRCNSATTCFEDQSCLLGPARSDLGEPEPYGRCDVNRPPAAVISTAARRTRTVSIACVADARVRPAPNVKGIAYRGSAMPSRPPASSASSSCVPDDRQRRLRMPRHGSVRRRELRARPVRRDQPDLHPFSERFVDAECLRKGRTVKAERVLAHRTPQYNQGAPVMARARQATRTPRLPGRCGS
jgi:hypothetical protein